VSLWVQKQLKRERDNEYNSERKIKRKLELVGLLVWV
jgi:hypothetical protein